MEEFEYIKNRLDELDTKVDDLIELSEPSTHDLDGFKEWKGW